MTDTKTDLKKVENFSYSLEKIFPDAEDFLPIMGTDYVEYYVGNAKQAAHFYKTALGFQSLAYAGLETKVKDRTSYVVVQDKIRLVFTTPMPDAENTEISDHISNHGDGVKVIALWVEDAEKAWKETTKRGAKSYFEPRTEKMEMARWFGQASILMETRFMFLLNEETIMEYFCRGTRNGNPTIIPLPVA